MGYILNIETSTDICSCCISKDGQVIENRQDRGRNHASILGVFIDEMLKNQNLQIKDFDAVAICKGPGSYTGLRIGTSTGKGLAYQSDIKLIATDSLQAMAYMFVDNIKNYLQLPDYKDCIIVSTMDAGRDEIYYQTYNINKEKLSDSKAEKITENSFTELWDSNSLIFIGNASSKVEKILNANQNLFFVHQIEPLAQYFPILSHKQYLDKDFVDVAYFEPFYLKDFIATISKKNPLQKNY